MSAHTSDLRSYVYAQVCINKKHILHIARYSIHVRDLSIAVLLFSDFYKTWGQKLSYYIGVSPKPTLRDNRHPTGVNA